MSATRFPHIIAAGLLSLMVGGLAGCGGGGGGAATAGATLGPAASSVSSADGKVTLAVGDNALQAPATISIAAAAPDAEIAGDPALVPGTTYAFTAPDIEVPEQVLITIESPLAIAETANRAVATAAVREHALALPPGYMPPPTCLVNNPGVLAALQPVKTIKVNSVDCPAAPAPACIKIYTFGAGVSVQTLCAPAQDVILIPDYNQTVCPQGYDEVTSDPVFAGLVAENGGARICQRIGAGAPPVLVNAARTSSINCAASNGKFVCPAPKLPSGTYSVLWDKTPPPEPYIDLANENGGIGFALEENGPARMISVRIKANDPNGIGGVELMEILPDPVPWTNIADSFEFPVAQRWRADPAQFQGAKVTNFDSGVFQIPYTFTDPAKRRFFARVFDRAGNGSRKNSPEVMLGFFNKITVNSFSVTPSSVPLPGGPVTLSWSITGAQSASIDNGVGALTVSSLGSPSTGSRVVNVSAGTTFTVTATHPTRNTKTAVATVVIGADTTPPTVSLAASPQTVVAPGSTTLTATASDLVGVSKVEFYRGATLIATDTATPFQHAVAFTPADLGSVAFTAKAFDAANNSATSAVLSVSVGADVTPPTVSLAANPATVLVPGATTLQASASDAIGVTKVEFYRGASLIATKNAAPYQHTVNLALADLGSISFTAKAYDAQNNVATSAPVLVLASTPMAGDTYASPSGVDAGNTSCAQATPCRTIAKAAQLAQANKTVWLMNGDYTGATQPVPIAVPAGLTLRALTPGLAGVGQGIVLQGGGSVVGVVVRRYGFGDNGYIQASAGSVTLDGVRVAGSLTSVSGSPAAISLSGSVHVTMSPGAIADYADQLTPAGQGVSVYASLEGAARLTINGGLFGGAALGGADPLSGSVGRGAFILKGTSRLDLNNAVVNVDSSGIRMAGTATQLHMNASLLHSNVNTGGGSGVHAAEGSPQITLVNSSITGFGYSYDGSSKGIQVGTFGQPGVAATLSVNTGSLNGNDQGLFVRSDSASANSLTLTGSNLAVSANAFGGLICGDACNIDLAGSEISGNGSTNPVFTGAYTFFGGLWMGSPTKSYTLKLRNVQVVDNKSLATANTNTTGNSGITMAGTAASSYDLGTAASPGGNTFTGNNTGSQTAGLNVAVAASVTVSAVGNLFTPNAQGASAQGQYALGTSPCGASSCNLTSGTGANYRISSGTLRLAQ